MSRSLLLHTPVDGLDPYISAPVASAKVPAVCDFPPPGSTSAVIFVIRRMGARSEPRGGVY